MKFCKALGTTNPAEIIAKLLISVDRRKSLREAEENVNLAIQLRKKYPDIVVGIDFSGDARVGNAKDFIPVLLRGQENGLKLTAHVAEVPNHDEVEALLGVAIRPDRIGHGTCIHPKSEGGSTELWKRLSGTKIPVEVCLTSNVLCKSVQKYEDHHVGQLIEDEVDFLPCTDDKGAFGCSLTHEYTVLKDYFKLSLDQLYKISRGGILQSFASKEEKELLLSKWEEWRKLNMSNE